MKNENDVKTYDFNSHAHVERDSIPPFQTEREGYFNSHAHVERDLIDNGSIIVTEISTHTLTWSVTQQSMAWVASA